MPHHAITFAFALALASAVAAATAVPSFARGKAHSRIGKRPADAHGYFFYPPNWMDDMYVYNPSYRRVHHKHPRRTRRHHVYWN
jgi:hypothetical protein